MNLLHLSRLTGHRSVSEMSLKDLMEHLHHVRAARILPRPTPSGKPRVTSTAEKKPRTTKSKLPDPSKMSQADLEMLLKQLGG